jgi:hypothetical protein
MNAAEKVGAKWSLSRFMMANWGNKTNELQHAARVADGRQAVKSPDWQKGFHSVNSIRSGLTSFSVLSLSTIPHF